MDISPLLLSRTSSPDREHALTCARIALHAFSWTQQRAAPGVSLAETVRRCVCVWRGMQLCIIINTLTNAAVTFVELVASTSVAAARRASRYRRCIYGLLCTLAPRRSLLYRAPSTGCGPSDPTSSHWSQGSRLTSRDDALTAPFSLSNGIYAFYAMATSGVIPSESQASGLTDIDRLSALVRSPPPWRDCLVAGRRFALPNRADYNFGISRLDRRFP